MMDWLAQGVDQLLGRASGPLHLRLVIMPTTVTVLAIRAGLRDAREGRPAFLWALVTSPAERRQLLHDSVEVLGRIFVFALVLDTVYQLTVLREIHIGQLLIVAVLCAIVPYVAVRGPVNRIARACKGNTEKETKEP